MIQHIFVLKCLTAVLLSSTWTCEFYAGKALWMIRVSER